MIVRARFNAYEHSDPFFFFFWYRRVRTAFQHSQCLVSGALQSLATLLGWNWEHKPSDACGRRKRQKNIKTVSKRGAIQRAAFWWTKTPWCQGSKVKMGRLVEDHRKRNSNPLVITAIKIQKEILKILQTCTTSDWVKKWKVLKDPVSHIRARKKDERWDEVSLEIPRFVWTWPSLGCHEIPY